MDVRVLTEIMARRDQMLQIYKKKVVVREKRAVNVDRESVKYEYGSRIALKK